MQEVISTLAMSNLVMIDVRIGIADARGDTWNLLASHWPPLTAIFHHKISLDSRVGQVPHLTIAKVFVPNEMQGSVSKSPESVP